MSEKRRIVIQNSRKKSISRGNISKRPKRTHKKPDRYGARKSASDRDAFFDQISSNTDSDNTTDIPLPNSDIYLIESSESHSDGLSSCADDLDSIRDNGPTSPSGTIVDDMRTSPREISDAQIIHLLTPPHETNDVPSPVEGICSCDRQTTSHETNIIAKLDEILKRISCIEKNTAKIEVRLRNLEESIARVGIDIEKGTNDSERDFIQLGLPVKNQRDLDKLEEDLNSEDFRQKMVINMTNIEYLFKNFPTFFVANSFLDQIWKIKNSVGHNNISKKSNRIFVH